MGGRFDTVHNKIKKTTAENNFSIFVYYNFKLLYYVNKLNIFMDFEVFFTFFV